MCPASHPSTFNVVGEAIKVESKYKTEQRLKMKGRKKPHDFYSEDNILTLCVERDHRSVFSYLYLMLGFQITVNQTSCSQRMSIITCSLTWLLPRWETLGQHKQIAFICLHFHLTKMKTLGASDFMLAITIIIVAFYSPLQRMLAHWKYPQLCKAVSPLPSLELELPWQKLTLSLYRADWWGDGPFQKLTSPPGFLRPKGWDNGKAPLYSMWRGGLFVLGLE